MSIPEGLTCRRFRSINQGEDFENLFNIHIAILRWRGAVVNKRVCAYKT